MDKNRKKSNSHFSQLPPLLAIVNDHAVHFHDKHSTKAKNVIASIYLLRELCWGSLVGDVLVLGHWPHFSTGILGLPQAAFN